MAFFVPDMPLKCEIWTNSEFPDGSPRLTDIACNLAWGKRVAVPSTGGTGSLGVPLFTMTLLLPKLTDIRSPLATTDFDFVEVPSGSARFYQVYYVDDLGKGFPNEHRGAIIYAIRQPTPLN